MLLALIDGSARPAGELARLAGIGAAGASAHLRRLVAAGLLAVDARGRHRYFRLADEDVARLVETLATAPPRAPRPLPSTDAALARARTCYRHLAGRLGVALFDRLGAVDGLVVAGAGVRLGANGVALLVDAGLVEPGEDAFATLPGRSCLDWTERRPHLSGALGTRLLARLIERGWLRPCRDTRALRVGAHARDGWRALGIDDLD